MSKKSFLALAILFLLGLSIFSITAGVHAQTTTQGALTTDKPDYSPEQTVTVTGTGFAPFTSYYIPIIRPDGSVVKGDGTFTPGYDTVTTDGNGNFVYTYILDGVQGTYEIRLYASDWTGDLSQTPLASQTFTDSADWTTQLFAWDRVQQKWVSGNLAGYNEGDYVAFLYVITNKQKVTATVPDITSEYNYLNLNTNAVGIDFEQDFAYGTTDLITPATPPPTPGNIPSGYTSVTPTPTAAFDELSGQQVDYVYQFSTGQQLAAGNTLYVYLNAHLAVTSVWQTNGVTISYQDNKGNTQTSPSPHYGAAYYPGASLQVAMDLVYSGVSAQTQSIPVLNSLYPVPEPSTLIAVMSLAGAAGFFVVYRRQKIFKH